MLPLVRKRINRILEATAVTPGEIEDEYEADEGPGSDDDNDRGI